ncbi:MAG: flagellar filament outer layer protein FlaA, partial [Pseudoflavonifractor sp.]
GPVTWSVAGGGTVSAEGVFTAGAAAGMTKITGSGGGATGSATVTVVTTPDTVTLADEKTGAPVTALVLAPNQVCDLKAVAAYKHMPLLSQDSCYTWTADPTIGTVDANGVLTASAKSGSGNLTATVAGKSVTIPVAVAGHVNTLESFENDKTAFTSTAAAGVAPETNLDYVRYGTRSLRVAYDTTLSGSASITAALNIAPGERYLNLWVYGNSSTVSMTATVADAAGAASEVLLTALDFSGWKYLSVPLPAGTAGIRSLNFIHGGGEQMTGTLWLDQLTTSNEPLQDTVPPVVSVSLAGTQLTAAVGDNVDQKFTQQQLSATYDGAAVKLTWDGA